MRPGQMDDLPDRLNGVRLKLERAEHHLAELTALAAEVTDAYTAAVTPVRSEGNRRIYKIDDGAPTLPEHFTTLVGDCLHNARSALDHLAWQLVVRDGGQPDRRRTQFPILKHCPTAQHPLTVIGGVHDDSLALIDELQPYHWIEDDLRPERHPLAVLAHLNNVDKHRGLLVGVTVISTGSWSVQEGQALQFRRYERSVHPGDEFGEMVVEPPDSEVHDLSLEFQVRLDDEPEAGTYALFDLVGWCLRMPLNYIELGVLKRLAPLFQ